MEFHISRISRDRYQFDPVLFSYNGNAILANFHAARTFARRMNEQRDIAAYPELAVQAGQINAMGLIDEILHHIIQLYREQRNPKVFKTALQQLDAKFSRQAVDHMLLQFLQEFPPVDVYQNRLSPAEYLAEKTAGRPNREEVLEELLLLRVTNENPAMQPYAELFTDKDLIRGSVYASAIHELEGYFQTQPRFGPDQLSLLEMLRSPALASPNSLEGQLDFIRNRWTELIGSYLFRLLGSLDLIKEERKLALAGPGPVEIPIYARRNLSGMDLEEERFSPDQEWMPRLVLLAKNTYVWLHQLSRKYGREINRLDQIPDEELDRISRAGFSGLWLIGLWERSHASARIKQMCGNPEAIASAYSLFDYSIAAPLGGDGAYENLRHRAQERGIRLASDMVPNHMGIDSPWVANHPDWFLSLDYLPFPSHSFNGPNLSSEPAIGIYVEDHYFNRTDAAVEFKRIDFHTGDTRYIYHGNDGTSMPWNDTAQLNYLNPDVREAVIQTILNVARKFPIIRFDAAMTLTKRHFQRLWFPEPGSGGDIPTRSDFGLTKARFEELMPDEFWREVVDRVAAEAPDTLLLAEAFWLMEGYFVRSLGMHRVYNSAFMHMLRNEDNAGYRQLIKSTLEFDPEILKRYVNFMNNPDERTAVDQFGKGDKYFGTCTLLATLPGLPMFGHGQVEGFSEKYGMEFTRPLWQEEEDLDLIQNHERLIFPLLHQRVLFAGVENFQLFDLFTNSGNVDENVYAFTNAHEGKTALVVYHNQYSQTSGWLKTSCAKSIKLSAEKRRLTQKNLAECLGVNPAPDSYVTFRDHVTGLEYLRPAIDLTQNGFFLDLGGYQVHVFLDFQQVQDDAEKTYGQLYASLGGRGVPNLEIARREMNLQPILEPFELLANPGFITHLQNQALKAPENRASAAIRKEFLGKIHALVSGASRITQAEIDPAPVTKTALRRLDLILALPKVEIPLTRPGSARLKKASSIFSKDPPVIDFRAGLFAWLFLSPLRSLADPGQESEQVAAWLDEWQLAIRLERAFLGMGFDPARVDRLQLTVRILTQQQGWHRDLGRSPHQLMQTWVSDPEIQSFLGINRYQDILWFNQEAFEEFTWWMMMIAYLDRAGDTDCSTTEAVHLIYDLAEIQKDFRKAMKRSKYQLNFLLASLKR